MDSAGVPLRRARVVIASEDGRFQRGTRTDDQGRYRFDRLPAGRYTLAASKTGYVSAQYGQRRATEGGTPLPVGDGQSVEHVDLTLIRGAALAGRVFDELGEPAENVLVRAMREQSVAGRMRLAATGRVGVTNDLGEYRVYGLPPGHYIVSATVQRYSEGEENDDRVGYGPTYYPGSATAAEAQAVDVGAGQQLAGLNFALVATRTANLSGTAVDSSGQPMTSGLISITQLSRAGESAFRFTTSAGSVKPDGTFVISNIAPGEYRLALVYSTLSGDAESAVADVTVSGDDVAGLRLAGVRSGRITGRIVLEGDRTAAVPLSSLRLNAIPVDRDAAVPFTVETSRSYDDGTFELKTRPGKVLLWAAEYASQRVMLKAVFQHGADVTDRGIDVRSAEDAGGVEAVFTTRMTMLSGGVTTGRDEAVGDCTVLVFPVDRDRWSYPSRFLRAIRPDQGGRFEARGLPAGEYLAVAVDAIDRGDIYDRDLLEQSSRHGVRFTLGEGGSTTLDLRIVR